ncbi:MAG: gamma-glutamylcyclotransferase family protein [Holophaga sp.]|jgi:gamma-glutamylcyclotransferase (GGCT)/AIG2-like uncharacterized protein YtfP
MKYFTYGSNLSLAHTRDYIPNAKFVMRASLPNFRVEFRYYSVNYKGGISSIIEAPGDMVQGVIYEVDEGELVAMDILEQVPNRVYLRERFCVLGEDGKWHHADLYRVAHPYGPFTPAKKYVDFMIAGAKEHGLDAEYTDRLVRLRQSLD